MRTPPIFGEHRMRLSRDEIGLKVDDTVFKDIHTKYHDNETVKFLGRDYHITCGCYSSRGSRHFIVQLKQYRPVAKFFYYTKIPNGVLPI